MIYLDKNVEYNNFSGYYPGYCPYDNFDPMQSEPNFNPMVQYEQGYMYYRYLTQVMEYKIKCKEYEKLTSKDIKQERRID